MDSLGEDLVLLSIRPSSGRIWTANRIDYGLMGSELIRLAAKGRVRFQAGQIVVTSQAPTGDAELDAALGSLARARQPVRPKNWVGRPRPRIRRDYLNRLAASGAVRPEPGRFFGTRWFITDQARLADARARLDAIALSAGQIDAAQAAFGGLAHAIAIVRLLYRGSANRPVRKRMAQVADGKWTAAAVDGAVGGAGAGGPAGSASEAAIAASIRDATVVAIEAIRAAAAAAASGG